MFSRFDSTWSTSIGSCISRQNIVSGAPKLDNINPKCCRHVSDFKLTSRQKFQVAPCFTRLVYRIQKLWVIFLFVYSLMLQTPLEVVRLRGYLSFLKLSRIRSWTCPWRIRFLKRHICIVFFCILRYCTTRSLVVLQHCSLPFALFLPISLCCQLFDKIQDACWICSEVAHSLQKEQTDLAF